MRFTRRGLVKLGATVAVAACGVSAAAWHLRGWARRALWERLPTEIPPGELDTHVARTLMAATHALLDAEIEDRHYREFFAWHSAEIPGYSGFYERATTLLDTLAQRQSGLLFADCALPVRRQMLLDALAFRNSTMRRLWTSVVGADWLMFDRHFVRPLIDLFAATDAWVLLGYHSWPGQPGGLAHYRDEAALKTDSSAHLHAGDTS
jgi:hypothetical protein